MNNNMDSLGKRIEIWRIKHVADYTGMSKGHIYNLVSLGKIPYFKKGRLLYFIASEIENWLLEGG